MKSSTPCCPHPDGVYNAYRLHSWFPLHARLLGRPSLQVPSKMVGWAGWGGLGGEVGRLETTRVTYIQTQTQTQSGLPERDQHPLLTGGNEGNSAETS